MPLYALDGERPQMAESAYLAPGAQVVGRVRVDDRASLWFQVVARGDVEPIVVGAASNVQDGCVLHTDEGFPLTVGRRVTVGHRVILHGCTVEDDALIGMGAVVLSGARVGRGAIVGAGALLPEGARVPPGHLAMGVPARVLREATEEDGRRARAGAQRYVERAERYRRGLTRT